ncbi:MAG: DUF433 domain-containing protein [Candidatus Hydrogenedentes bacterium]|nr:DUF433 domain-containing protein [Candidatus Hydrogenedentota bacterium]
MNDRITIDPQVCHGKPVIKGTRVPVVLVLGSLAGGMTYDEIEQNYDVTRDDILAALRFAEDVIEQGEYFPLTV